MPMKKGEKKPQLRGKKKLTDAQQKEVAGGGIRGALHRSVVSTPPNLAPYYSKSTFTCRFTWMPPLFAREAAGEVQRQSGI